MVTARAKDFQRARLDRFFSGSLLVSVGIILTTSGGSWDITNHLINKPETFFSIPHTVLYAGAAVAIAGAAIMFHASRQNPMPSRVLPAKLSLGGSLTLLGAGPADFLWHQAFGLDGLLSPTHMMLVIGMLCASLGGLQGLRQGVSDRSNPRPLLTTTLAMVSVWLSASGMLEMLTLPFSNTAHFKFNPDPLLAASLATIAFPFLSSIILRSMSAMTGGRFGCLSALGSCFVLVVTLTTIMPDEKIIISIPFYLINLIPIVASDILLTSSRKKIYTYLAGSIIGASFFTLYFPLITHTYNEVLTTSPVWPSMIVSTYFTNLSRFYPLVALPSAASGIFGTMISMKILGQKNGKSP